jgi:hypothetical protein
MKGVEVEARLDAGQRVVGQSVSLVSRAFHPGCRSDRQSETVQQTQHSDTADLTMSSPCLVIRTFIIRMRISRFHCSSRCVEV